MSKLKPRPLFAGCPTHPEHADRKHDYMGNVSNYGDPCSFQIEPASSADLLAVVRRGVESGEIEGEFLSFCIIHRGDIRGNHTDECEREPYLVIPDGGGA